MIKNKHQSKQTISNDININEQLETYKNKVHEVISKTDAERSIYRLMNKNKLKGEKISAEVVRTYVQKPQRNKVGESEKEERNE